MNRKYSTEKWRFLDSGHGDPDFNMALDEALLWGVRKNFSPPTIRFFSWSRPAITLGYRQNYFQEIQGDKARQEGIPVIRRITGGLAVFHWKELTYSAVFRYAQTPYIQTAVQWFTKISLGLVDALRALNLDASLDQTTNRKHYSIRGRTDRNAQPQTLCFALPAGVDITVGGKKIVGSAQRKFKNCFLQQGSILIARDPDRELSFAGFKNQENKILIRDKINTMVTSITEETGRRYSYEDLVPFFRLGLEKILLTSMYSGELLQPECDMCTELLETKYRSDDWNMFGRWEVPAGYLK